MAFETAVSLAKDEEFHGRVAAAITAAALDVAGERDTQRTFNVRQRRQLLASKVLADPAAEAPRFAWALAANPTIQGSGAGGQASVSDNDIAYVVTSVWDDLSGASEVLALAD